MKCLNCQKEFEPKRKDTAKFCSATCRVQYNRVNPKDKVTKVQMQVLYNMAMSALEELRTHKPLELPKDYLNVTNVGILRTDGQTEPLNFSKPQIALKSFEQWKREKHECENEEDWERIKSGIMAATNLTSKQKDLLIKYS